MLRADVGRALAGTGHAVLAVSGGLDSMVLLDLAAAAGADPRPVVATFDHGTGAHARMAAELVVETARALGLTCRVGRMFHAAPTEAIWREGRWRFLGALSREAGMSGVVVTAHTRDDQVETVLLRILRGAGTRGLAGLAAPSTRIRRPLLHHSRASLASYARARGLTWIEDPSNASRRHLRNRVRLDLLPALRAVWPEVDDALERVGRDAAAWRAALAAAVDARLPHRVTEGDERMLIIALAPLAALDDAALRVAWPELASRVGVVLDRRGIARAAAFTREVRTGASVPLAGGWRLGRERDAIVLLRADDPLALGAGDARNRGTGDCLALEGAEVRWRSWRFRRDDAGDASADDDRDRWRARLPLDARLTVRGWRAGDRLRVAHPAARERGSMERKVKYFLSDAGIVGHRRAHWPVVLAGDEIAWIPGVRRGVAATARSGRPAVTYVCDYLDR